MYVCIYYLSPHKLMSQGHISVRYLRLPAHLTGDTWKTYLVSQRPGAFLNPLSPHIGCCSVTRCYQMMDACHNDKPLKLNEHRAMRSASVPHSGIPSANCRFCSASAAAISFLSMLPDSKRFSNSCISICICIDLGEQ